MISYILFFSGFVFCWRVMIVYGTRPEMIKLGPLIREMRKENKWEIYILCTAQHERTALRPLEDLFKITPDEIGRRSKNSSLATIYSNKLRLVEHSIINFKPDIVIVQGDTATAAAAAQAAFLMGIRIGHVEAGLRTRRLDEPFPEEFNRRMIDSISNILWAPTKRSFEALEREGIETSRIHVTGNTGIDAAFWVSKTQRHYDLSDIILEAEIFDIVLVTIHRRENWPRLISICHGISSFASNHAHVIFLLPVHFNGAVATVIREQLGRVDNIHLVEPYSYTMLISLLQQITLLLTDSGGLQEEATAFGVPTLTIRHATERQEGIEAGVIRLVEPESASIEHALHDLLDIERETLEKMRKKSNVFGDGHASERIVKSLEEFLGRKDNTPIRIFTSINDTVAVYHQ